MEGTVKWFNRRKGFGFITSADEKDYFVHHSSLQEGKAFLNDGEKVTFEPTKTEKGLQATNVVVVSE